MFQREITADSSGLCFIKMLNQQSDNGKNGSSNKYYK